MVLVQANSVCTNVSRSLTSPASLGPPLTYNAFIVFWLYRWLLDSFTPSLSLPIPLLTSIHLHHHPHLNYFPPIIPTPLSAVCPPDADVSPSLAQYSLVFPSLSSSPCFSHFQSGGTTSQSPHILLTLKERQPQQHSTSQRREGGRGCLAAMFSRIRTSLFPPVLCAR